MYDGLLTGESKVLCNYMGCADSISVTLDDTLLFIKSDEGLFTCSTSASTGSTSLLTDDINMIRLHWVAPPAICRFLLKKCSIQIN